MMKKPDVTIIMPCYNSERTLIEAIESVLQQRLSYSYECVFVDDGSTDTTPQIIKSYVSTNRHFRSYSHAKNKGGGAARNTAIKHARADLIFCLDSDDILDPDMLQQLISVQKKKRCDGVGAGIHTKFIGSHRNNIDVIEIMKRAGDFVIFDDFFKSEPTPTSFTYLHTKKSWKIMGGYPEFHGFDTQGFSMRFLSNGFKLFVVPQTKYLQRVRFNKSYYIREFEQGNISRNWYNVLEEFLYLFDEETQRFILEFDLNDYTKDLWVELSKRKNKYVPRLKTLIIPNTQQKYAHSIKSKRSPTFYDLYWLACYQDREGKVKQANITFRKAFSVKPSDLVVNARFQNVKRPSVLLLYAMLAIRKIKREYLPKLGI